MRTSIALLLFGLMYVVSGCALQQQPAPAQVFYLMNLQPDVQDQTQSAALCFRIRPVSVQAPFAGTSLIYRSGEVMYERDYYNQFLVPADQQLGEALAAWLPATGLRRCGDGDAEEERLTLEPHLEAIYIDFRDAATASAYVRLRFTMTTYDRTCRCDRVLLDESYEAATALPLKPTAEQAVQAMSQSVKQTLEAFIVDLERLLP